jgi:predicted kinase
MERHAAAAKLIIVCGLPGAGKTTHARLLEARFSAIRLCPDEWMKTLSMDLRDEAMRDRIESLQWTLAQRLLTLGCTVIIEWGTWGRPERDALRMGARSLGAAVELHYLSAPVDVLFERVRKRGMENPPVERKDFLLWADTFQEPTAEEMALFDSPSTTETDLSRDSVW